MQRERERRQLEIRGATISLSQEGKKEKEETKKSRKQGSCAAGRGRRGGAQKEKIEQIWTIWTFALLPELNVPFLLWDGQREIRSLPEIKSAWCPSRCFS